MKKLFFILLMSALPAFVFALAAEALPEISASDASGNTVTIPAKDNTSSCLYIYTFSKPKDGLTDTYIKAYADIFGENARYFQVAVFGPVPLFDGFIKDAIKNGTKPEKRSSMILYFGDKEKLMKQLDEKINESVQWYIVNKEGSIVKSRSTGGQIMASEADIKEMKEAFKIISEVKNGKR